MPGVLSLLQDTAVAALAADPMFLVGGYVDAGVPIITEQHGDLATDIQTAVDKLGLCAVVVTPTFELFDPLQRSFEGNASLAVQVFEQVLMNATGVHAKDVAERVVNLLHWRPTGLPAAPSPGLANPPVFLAAKRAVVFASEGPPLQYVCAFTARLTLYSPTN